MSVCYYEDFIIFRVGDQYVKNTYKDASTGKQVNKYGDESIARKFPITPRLIQTIMQRIQQGADQPVEIVVKSIYVTELNSKCLSKQEALDFLVSGYDPCPTREDLEKKLDKLIQGG